jgi:hypothetical protein
MVNKDRPHVFVLPEDDANRQLANAFHKIVDGRRDRQMQVLPVARGWKKVLERFNDDQVQGMDKWPDRLMILLIDFDNRPGRLNTAKAAIPRRLSARVFILGTLSEPEFLKATLGSYETIGETLGEECRDNTYTTWATHKLLRHNANELARLRQHVRPILF